MALQINFELPSGVTQSYHRIRSGTVDFSTGATTLQIDSFISAEARAAGKLPIGGMSVTLPVVPTFDGDPRPWAYAKLKERPEFSGATDV